MAEPVPTVDPNVRIPEAVRAGAAAAENIHKQAYQTETPPVEAAPEAAPVTPEVTPEPVESAPAPDTERQLNGMKGRLTRSQNELRAAADRIMQLEAHLAATQQQAARPAPQPERLLTDKEVTEYGEEFIDVTKRAAKEVLAPEVEQLRQEVQQLRGHVSHQHQQAAVEAETRLHNQLDVGLPAWREVNNNPKFLEWLSLPDTFSGGIRHSLLKHAYERRDANRVLAFFNGFLTEEATVAREPIAAPTTPSGKVPLENFAAPGRAKTAAANAPAEKPIFTRDFISKLGTAKALGKFRGREDEYARQEAQYFEAVREGRIRN